MLYRIAATIVFLLVFFGISTTVNGQQIATLEINISGGQSLVDIPVQLSPDPITSLHSVGSFRRPPHITLKLNN